MKFVFLHLQDKTSTLFLEILSIHSSLSVFFKHLPSFVYFIFAMLWSLLHSCVGVMAYRQYEEYMSHNLFKQKHRTVLALNCLRSFVRPFPSRVFQQNARRLNRYIVQSRTLLRYICTNSTRHNCVVTWSPGHLRSRLFVCFQIQLFCFLHMAPDSVLVTKGVHA